MSERQVEFIECACIGEGISISKWDDEEEIYMSWFVEGHGAGRYAWRYRLQHIWQIIRKGYPYLDDLILSKQDAGRLARTLMRFVSKKEG